MTQLQFSSEKNNNKKVHFSTFSIEIINFFSNTDHRIQIELWTIIPGKCTLYFKVKVSSLDKKKFISIAK